MRLVFAILAMLPLVACGSSDNVKRADVSPPRVTFNIDDTKHMNEADDKATAYCGRYDRAARLESLVQQNGYYVANYVCR